MSHEIISKHLHGTLTAENTKYEYKDELYKGAKLQYKYNLLI